MSPALKQFLITWGSLIVAVAALFQPWVIAFWKKYVRRGKVEIYETGLIELGYSTLGPTVGLLGTLRAVDRDLFIRGIKLKVVRQKDSSVHLFDWLFFRPQSLGTNESAELAYSFLLLTQQPFRYSIQFRDTGVFEDLKPALDELRDTWFRRWQQAGPTASMNAMELSSDPDPEEEVFSEFSKDPVSLSTYSILQRRNFWEAGKYDLEMTVTASNPDRSFSRRWFFKLDDGEAERLRLNAIPIIRNTCGLQKVGHYNFSLQKYEA